MKKIYKAPTTKLHNVGVHHMLCGSNPDDLTDTKDNPAVNPNDPNSNLGKEDFGW